MYIMLIMLLGGSLNAYSADPCDRACMEGHIDQVLDAMIAHNHRVLNLSKDIRYTENGVELILGDGLWGTLSGRGNYNLYICDVKSGQAGFYGTVSENGRLNYIALRVKVRESLITEIEMLVVRPDEKAGLPNPPGDLTVGKVVDDQSVRPQFLQTVPPDERMSRETLIQIANSYFTGLANQTGQFTAPFAESCERLENGNQTTNQEPNPAIPEGGIDILCMTCEEQQESGWFAFVTEIRNRRFPVVDQERGLVLSFGYFDHNAAAREYPLPDGSMTPNVLTHPITFEISELFQIRNGKIDQIEAALNTVPYGMKSDVWDK